jgi:hypothetical protein
VIKIINEKYLQVKHINKFSNNIKNSNLACYQKPRLVLTNTSNNFNKDNQMFLNLNPNTTKTKPNLNNNFNSKGEYCLGNYNSTSNIDKRTLNASYFFLKNYESNNINNKKLYQLDAIPLLNQTNKFTFLNLSNKNSNNIFSINKKNEFLSTKNSNLISTNYKTQVFAANTKGSYFNHSMNSIVENNKNSIYSNKKFKISDSNLYVKNSNSLKNTKAKNRSISKDINQIIRTIYDYSDVSTKSSNNYQKNKSLEKINEEGSPRNNKFSLGKNVKNNFNFKPEESKNAVKQPQKIKLSLMEKYLISTDYSMNLTFKMR